MKSIAKPPVKVSADVIRSYYYLNLDQKQESNSGVVIDDACYELMFVKEKDVCIITGDDARFLLPPCYTLNFLKGPFRFAFGDTFTTFCIKLQPWMNASFVPIRQSQLLSLTQLYSEAAMELHVALFHSSSMDEMIGHAERFLLSLSISPNKDVETVREICSLIYEKSGNITVNEIVDRFNIYRQKLNQLFKQEVKYTLKTFINNVRIRACLSYKLNHPETSLTEIAYQFGYYDQAHFIRSFKKATGVSPSEYVKYPGYSFVATQAKV